MINYKYLAAEKEASKLIEKYGISSPEDIRLEDIATDNNIIVTLGDLRGAAASIIKSGDYATIRVPSTGHEGRKRFSIGHELGHFFLEHLYEIQKICTNENMQSWYSASEETEANFFASELILPKALVEKRCDVKKVNFEPIKAIREDFKASLTATAIRFIRFCPEACAVVFSKGGKICWSYQSESWWPFIERGKVLDNRTLAYDFFVSDKTHEDPEDVEADAWFNAKDVEEIVEHSIPSPEFGFVLSILWIKQ